MPWCDDCGRFYTPSTLTPAGDCPSGHHVADPAEHGLRQSDDPEGEDHAKVPWHFWLLLAALAVYLGWRLVQGIGWLLS